MDAKRIHEEITQLLYKVEEQYGRIIHFKDSIPLIEVDLALKDVRDLYESLLDLRTIEEIKRRRALSEPLEKPKQAEEVPAQKEVIKEEPKLAVDATSEPKADETKTEEGKEVENNSLEEVKIDELSEVKSEDVLSEVKGENVVKAEEEATKEEPVIDETPKKEEEVKSPLLKEEKPASEPKKDLLQERQQNFVPTVRKIEFKPQPLSEEPKKESIFEKAASLYDKIAKPAEKTVASQANKQPISNIKAAIGINEKFGYLKDLFKNNVNEYNSALDKLNNFDNYEEAEDYFQELKTKYEWNPEGKSFHGLAELLNRRYLHSD